jgi:hypothetical protein
MILLELFCVKEPAVKPTGWLPEVCSGVHENNTKMGRLSALYTGCLYTPGKIPVTYLWERLSQSQGHSVAGRIKLMKFSKTLLEIKLVLQSLNQLCYCIPLSEDVAEVKIKVEFCLSIP